MRFIVTYYDANQEKRVRLFKTLVEARKFISYMKSVSSGIFKDFEIKVVKPY